MRIVIARSLDAIVQELDAGYNPSRQAINDKVAGLPAQYAAEEAGLKAQEKDYFTNTIVGGARERGVAFGGIPEGERAQYGASTFLPALARLKTSQTEQQGSLMESLNSLNREQRGQAQGIYQGELDRDEQIRQFNAAQAASERQAAALRKAMATPTLTPPQAGTSPDANKQKAMLDVQGMLARRGTPSYYQELMAINKSAGYGNAYDKAKLELLSAMQPGLFINGGLNTARIQGLIAGNGSSGGGGGGW